MEIILKEDVINLGYKGDIVKVKVLEVDAARKRIALTMRLDDEVAPKTGGDKAPGAH